MLVLKAGWLVDVSDVVRVERQNAFGSFNDFSPAVATLKFREQFSSSLLQMWESGKLPSLFCLSEWLF